MKIRFMTFAGGDGLNQPPFSEHCAANMGLDIPETEPTVRFLKMLENIDGPEQWVCGSHSTLLFYKEDFPWEELKSDSRSCPLVAVTPVFLNEPVAIGQSMGYRLWINSTENIILETMSEKDAALAVAKILLASRSE